MRGLKLVGTALLALTLLVSGCTKTQAPWSATVTVNGDKATIRVDVPGKELTKDYHTHISLDDGPQAMMYAAAYTFLNLKPAHHKVLVVIADPKHNPIPGMEKTLEFDIK